MMNLLALALVLTSILIAGIFSPTPNGDEKDHVIVKQGHRVVVVEYDHQKEGDGNTKVLIAPQETHIPLDEITLKENLKEGSASSDPKEVICDAFGKCKDKIADLICISKEKVVDTAQKASDTVAEKTEQGAHKVSDKVYDVKEEAKDVAGGGIGKVKERVTDKAKDAAHKVSEKAHEVKEDVKDVAVNMVKHPVDTAKDLGVETLGRDISRNLTEHIMEPVCEKVKAAGKMAKEGAKKVKGGEANEFFRRGWVVLEYMVGLKDAMLAVVHLLGFAVAYGTCVWVTFVSSYVLSKAVPRYQYGVVISNIYEVYFKAMAYSVGTALVAYLLKERTRVWLSLVGMFQGWNLLAAMVMVLVNSLYLGPQASKVMFERMKLEKEEGIRPRGFDGFNLAEPSSPGVTRSEVGCEPLNESDTPEAAEAKLKIVRMGDRLKKMNSYSSMLNLATLMTLSCHLVYLAHVAN